MSGGIAIDPDAVDLHVRDPSPASLRIVERLLSPFAALGPASLPGSASLSRAAAAEARAEAEAVYARACDAFHGDGDGRERDLVAAVDGFARAAAAGLPDALWHLGVCLVRGEGLAVARAHGYRMFELADEAAGGFHPSATMSRAQALHYPHIVQQLSPALLRSVGAGSARAAYIDALARRALPALLRAAEAGNRDALFVVAKSHQLGLGTPLDPVAALEWYRRAADAGSLDAVTNLGSMYMRGDGVPASHAEANAWFERAATRGDAYAQHNLGVSYHRGRGVAADLQRSSQLFLAAARNGDCDAMFSLGVLATSVDMEVAVRWFRRAADAGSAAAHVNLAWCYSTGTVLARSFRESLASSSRAVALDADYADEANFDEVVDGRPRRQHIVDWAALCMRVANNEPLLVAVDATGPYVDAWSLRLLAESLRRNTNVTTVEFVPLDAAAAAAAAAARASALTEIDDRLDTAANWTGPKLAAIKHARYRDATLGADEARAEIAQLVARNWAALVEPLVELSRCWVRARRAGAEIEPLASLPHDALHAIGLRLLRASRSGAQDRERWWWTQG